MKNQTALNEYLLDLKLRNCSPRTIKTMKNNMSLLFNWIEAEYEIKEIEDIRRNHIKGYLQYKQSLGLKPTYNAPLYQQNHPLHNHFLHGYGNQIHRHRDLVPADH